MSPWCIYGIPGAVEDFAAIPTASFCSGVKAPINDFREFSSPTYLLLIIPPAGHLCGSANCNARLGVPVLTVLLRYVVTKRRWQSRVDVPLPLSTVLKWNYL